MFKQENSCCPTLVDVAIIFAVIAIVGLPSVLTAFTLVVVIFAGGAAIALLLLAMRLFAFATLRDRCRRNFEQPR